MKNKFSMRFPLFIIAIALGFYASANLPELNGGPLSVISIDNLPATVSPSNTDVYIDLDNDTFVDFRISYESNSGTVANGSGSSATIGFVESYKIYFYSTGAVISEYVYLTPPTSNKSKALAPPPAVPFTSILEQGTVIGSTAPTGMFWEYTVQNIWTNNLYSLAPDATLMDVNDGYLGIRYFSSGVWVYDWLHVRLNGNGTSLDILSSGASSSSSSAIAGLNDPFAVPVPLIASILGMGLVGLGAYLRKRKK